MTSGVPDRQFWQMIAEAAFTNPFSDQRYELDRQIAGEFESESQRVQLLKTAVCERVERLKLHGRAKVGYYRRSPEEGVMRNVFLFEIYHRFYADFDRVIVQQIAAGDSPCAVPFASGVLALLKERGFTADDSVRFFGIFYQLRRAFYFIAGGLTGHSACMKELRRHLWNNVFTHDIRWYDQYLWNRMEDFSTLLLGETGTGKGTAAAAIGRSGFIPFHPNKGTFAESFTHSFLSLNLSQFPQALIESELFGHKKGAFTGAIEAHEGVLARCSPHGAIFLDEIGRSRSRSRSSCCRFCRKGRFHRWAATRSFVSEGASLPRPTANWTNFAARRCSAMIFIIGFARTSSWFRPCESVFESCRLSWIC